MKFYKYRLSKHLSINNSCPITDVMLSHVETLRRIGNWNLKKEHI